MPKTRPPCLCAGTSAKPPRKPPVAVHAALAITMDDVHAEPLLPKSLRPAPLPLDLSAPADHAPAAARVFGTPSDDMIGVKLTRDVQPDVAT